MKRTDLGIMYIEAGDSMYEAPKQFEQMALSIDKVVSDLAYRVDKLEALVKRGQRDPDGAKD